MRSGLLALRAAGLVAAMVAVPVLGTTAADAHDSVNATVSPSDVRPGGEVKVQVTGCKNPRSVAARSDVFVADSELAARKGDDKKPTLLGEAKIKSSTKDGTYKADVWCDGHDHRGAAVFKVDRDAKPKASTKPSTKPSAKASAKPSAKVSPKPSAKPSAKASAKPSAKASAKASAKPKPKQSTKASSKPPTKPAAKASGKASAKPQPSPKPDKAKPNEAKPNEAKPNEAKPNEAKPNEAKSEGKTAAAPRSVPPATSAPPSKNLMPAPVRTGRQSQAPWTPQSAQAHPSEHQASPVAPVRAGGGGRTSTALAGDEAGPSTPHTVIGLVLAGVAAVAVAIRSARRRRSAARDSD
ncbi:hypothetical protein ACIBBB_10985 [Streptomyces sp. NPDC051217]|uniref:hypothetical protein n=1 Tax=Streptomyces sp. NPDC051217 TaxID=3365644 RepID=UPI0037B7F5AB